MAGEYVMVHEVEKYQSVSAISDSSSGGDRVGEARFLIHADYPDKIPSFVRFQIHHCQQKSSLLHNQWHSQLATVIDSDHFFRGPPLQSRLAHNQSYL